MIGLKSVHILRARWEKYWFADRSSLFFDFQTGIVNNFLSKIFWDTLFNLTVLSFEGNDCLQGSPFILSSSPPNTLPSFSSKGLQNDFWLEVEPSLTSYIYEWGRLCPKWGVTLRVPHNSGNECNGVIWIKLRINSSVH